MLTAGEDALIAVLLADSFTQVYYLWRSACTLLPPLDISDH
jgi:hypothetical protein